MRGDRGSLAQIAALVVLVVACAVAASLGERGDSAQKFEHGGTEEFTRFCASYGQDGPSELRETTLQLCSRLEKYAQWHRDTLDRVRRNDSGTPPRVLIWQCAAGRNCGGLGDRLRGIVSAHIAAMKTGRVFLVQYTKPARLAQVLIPRSIQWDFADAPENQRGLQATLSTCKTVRAMNSEQHHGRRALFVHGAKLMESVLNHSANDCIVIETNRRLSGAWLWSEHGTRINHPLAQTLPDNRIYVLSYNFLFSQSHRLLAAKQLLHDAMYRNSVDLARLQTPFVALHWRAGEVFRDHTRHKLNMGTARSFLRCALRMTKVLSANLTSACVVPIFVASDRVESLHVLRNVLGELDADCTHRSSLERSAEQRLLWKPVEPAIHIDRSRFSNRTAGERHHLMTWAEHALLQDAHCIVASHSGFSHSAVLLSAAQNGSRCWAHFDACDVDAIHLSMSPSGFLTDDLL
mmetsp:Transcript_5794/g.15449  ORF Transcript_5794/g.15449 Transcript_5794/m.15449 type:complete len:463 (-) Transcript_5794:1657-3045(-)